MKVKGLILAGGEGKRIGGKKPLRLLWGKPIVFWVLKPYLSQGLEVFISVRDYSQKEEIKEALSAENLPWERIKFVFDEKDCAGKGPLCGLLSGMRACEEKTYLLVSACDQPFLSPEIFQPLLKVSQSLDVAAVVYKVGEKLEPFPGIYSSLLKSHLEEFLRHSPKKSFKAFLGELNDKNLLDFLEYTSKILKNVNPFFNVNTLIDLKEAEGCFSLLKELKKGQ